MIKLCVLGEYLIDFTPVGKNEQGFPVYSQNPGGAPANVACAAAKLGAEAGIITKISTDAFGEFLYSYISRLPVDLRGVSRSDDPTGLAFVSLDDKGERSFTFMRKNCADSMLDVSDIPQELIEECEVFHFSSVSLVSEPARGAAIYAAQLARKLGKTVSFDINYRPFLWAESSEAARIIRDALPLADIVKSSDEDAALLADNTEKAAQLFLSLGAKLVLTTAGEKGSRFYAKNASGSADSFKVDAVDATGAGDNFMGAFLAKFIELGKRAEELTDVEIISALRYANAAGAVCASGYGAIAPQATPADIERLLAK